MGRPLSGSAWVFLETWRPPAAGREPKNVRSVTVMNFGKTPDGTPVELYVLKAGKLTVKVMTYGATITEIDAPGP